MSYACHLVLCRLTALTKSVDLFGQINSVDLILNDIWIEPESPIEWDIVTIHGSVYNAGIIPTEDVTDTVTIAYIVNGEISEINLLENILPWLENGKVVSSGPVFNSIQGELTDIHLEKSEDQEIIIDIEGIKQEKTISDMHGKFLFETDIQFNDEPIRISTCSRKVSFN